MENKTDMEKRLEELAAYVASLEAENNKLKSENTSLKKSNEKLQISLENLNEQIIKRNKMLFGKKTEKAKYYCEGQLCFFNESELEYNKGAKEPTPETIHVAPHDRKQKRSKEEILAGIEHREVVIRLDQSERICKNCGAELTVIGKEFIRSQIEIIPEQVYIVDVYAETYKCAECEKKTDSAEIIKPVISERPIKKSMASASAIAYVMTEKFQMGTPLYRLEQYWKSRGVDLNRNTLARWVIHGSLVFKPLINYLNRLFNTLRVAHCDETGFNVLKRDGTPMNKRSTMWVRVSGKHEEHQFALYNYMRSKSQEAANELLGGFKGSLTTDGYEVYGNLTECTHTGCHAHGRRKFLDSVPKGRQDGKAYEALQLITRMYDLEREIQENAATLDEIKIQRQEKIKPVLEAYFACAESTNPLPGSHLDTAVNYVLKRKPELSVFINNPEVAIDNNRAERAIKPFVMARKNFLFADTEKGAEASADVFSIIETAKMNNLDVFGYLNFLLTELPKFGNDPTEEQLATVLPWNGMLPDYCMNQSKK